MTYDTAREFVLNQSVEKIRDVLDAANRGASLKQQADMLHVSREYWCKMRKFLFRKRWEPSPVLVDILETDALVKRYKAERAEELSDELKAKILPLFPSNQPSPRRA